jgi:hypothetical protein
MPVRALSLALASTVLALSACGAAGTATQSAAALSSEGLLSPTCETGWSCLTQAKKQVAVTLLSPSHKSAHFVFMSLYRTREGAVLEWKEANGDLVDLASYDTLNAEPGDRVAVRGTDGYLQLGAPGKSSILIWKEDGRWQVLVVTDEDEQRILDIANALQAA